MIGQIANCPKCGSMIMIAAPQQILVESGRPTDSVAVTREALPAPEVGLFTGGSVFEHGFRHAESPDALPPENEGFDAIPPGAWMPEPTPPPRADELPAAAATTVLPSQSRQLLLIAALGLCSVLLASGVLFGFLKWYAPLKSVAQSNRAVAALPADKGQGAATLSAPLLDTPPTTDQTLSPIAPPTSAADVGTEDASQASSEPLQGESTTTPNTASNVGQGTANSAGSDAPSSQASPNSLASNTPNAATTSPSSAPLGSTIAPNLDSTFDAPASRTDATAIVDTLPPGLQNFANIFDRGLEPVLPDASVPLSKAPEAGDDAALQAAPANTKSAPLLSTLPEDVQRKQAITFSGLAIQNRPLSEVLTTLSLISDIPIVVDLDAVLAGGVPRNPIVSFKSVKPVSISQVLDKIADQHQLSFNSYENRLLVARAASDAMAKKVPAALPIQDLVTDDQQTVALVQSLHELLPELQGQLKSADGHLHFDVNAENQLLWFQVARLLESWRSARGIENSTTSAIVPRDCLLPAWPAERMRETAQVKMSKNVPMEPLAQSWQRLSSEAKVSCWVDWPSLLSSQVAPNELATVVAPGRTFHDVLQHYASKYEVVFAVEDANSLWVTTPNMHRVQPRLYVLPLSDKPLETWRAELEALAPLDTVSGAAMLKLIPTSDGQFLLVRCCRPVLAAP